MKISDWKAGHFPKRLKLARQKAELTQAQLASQLGIRQATISRIEAGHEPRSGLSQRIVTFVEYIEQSKLKIEDDIVSAIGKSQEFKALIARVAAEL